MSGGMGGSRRGVVARAHVGAEPSRLLGDSPWTVAQLTTTLGVAVLALVGIAVTWLGSADAEVYNDQLAWLGTAIVVTALGVVAGVAWIGGGTRTVRLLRKEVLLDASSVSLGRLPTEPAHEEVDVVVVANGTRFHRPSCPFVAGKAVAAPRDRRSRRPCEVCKP
jgi:hypothetical protein